MKRSGQITFRVGFPCEDNCNICSYYCRGVPEVTEVKWILTVQFIAPSSEMERRVLSYN